MTKKLSLLIAAAILLATGVTACNMEDELPICDPDAVNLQPIFPNYRNMPPDLSSPSLQWRYYNPADSTDATCTPESQHISFGVRGYTEDGQINDIPLAEQNLGALERSYNFGIDLDPGGSYFWEVTWYADSGAVSRSRRIYFNAGPLCTRDELLPPVIISVPDGSILEPGLVYLSWNYQGGCVPQGVEFQISSTPDFVPSETEITAADFAFHAVSAEWETCRFHYWRVASTMTITSTDFTYMPDYSPLPLFETEPLPFTFTGYIRSDFTPTYSFYVTSEACPEPPAAPTEDTILPPLPKPIATVLQTANCRSGPTLDYPLVRILQQGERYPVVGRSRDGQTWIIGLVNIDDDIAWTPQEIRQKACWVHGSLVDVTGDVGAVQIIDPDPPPTAEPTAVPTVNCSQYTSPQSCANNSACYWDPNYPPNSNGSCRNK